MLAAILLLVPLLLLAAAASEPCGRSDALSSLAARGLPSPSWVVPDEEKAADPAAAAAPDDENALVAGSADICTPQSKS